jgi:general L-amino acid transport system permease protein
VLAMHDHLHRAKSTRVSTHYLESQLPPEKVRSWATLIHLTRLEFKQHPVQGAMSSILLVLVILSGFAFLNWGVFNAVFSPDEAACQLARSTGACWGVIAEKYRLILWGRFPFEEQWRPLTSVVLILLTLSLSCNGTLWRSAYRQWLYLSWIWCAVIFEILMSGTFFGIDIGLGLAKVETELWGGLPLTLLLSIVSIALATPLGILLALARTSDMPMIKTLAVTYIELVRGVPLISVLFMASFMFPLLMPGLKSPDVLLRVLAGITLFSAAYTAEVVRAGLLSVGAGQLEAAQSLGLGYWKTQGFVVLPQALAHVLPGLVNNFISIFKDTSLVTIVSLYELTGALGLALNGDAIWRPFKLEGYLFIGLIYFCFCFALSHLSQNFNKQSQTAPKMSA